jgi:predicted alpha/beta hydrolase
VLSEGEHIRQAYASVRLPITAVLFTDDTMASPDGIRAVHQAYTGTRVDYLVLRPQEVGARSVGHFNFFHGRTGPQAWRHSLTWLGLA